MTCHLLTVLTDRFDRALLYATHVHGGQARKGHQRRLLGDNRFG